MACVPTLLLLGGMATTPRPLPETTALRPPCTDREGPATAPARMATLQQAQVLYNLRLLFYAPSSARPSGEGSLLGCLRVAW